MNETQSQNLTEALAAFTDTAARLEVEGIEQTVIADALLSAGLSIGTALQGPAATASVLRQLAQRLMGDAVSEAAQDEPCEDPTNRIMWEAITTAVLSLKEHNVPARKVSEMVTVYGLTLAAKEIGPEALATWMEDWVERMVRKSPADQPTQH